MYFSARSDTKILSISARASKTACCGTAAGSDVGGLWGLRILLAVELDDLAFGFLIGVGDNDVHEEAIELRLRQRIGAFLFDRVLGRQHHEEGSASCRSCRRR